MVSPPDVTAKFAQRIARHREIEAAIEGLRDGELLCRLSDSPRLVEHGTASVCLPGSDATVFVKLLPLTDLELQPRHLRSTANLFDLPNYYHYRHVGCGFGTWRELAAHEIANRWVFSGHCSHFALLHGWRTLPIVHRNGDDELRTTLSRDDRAIRQRVSSVTTATHSAVLFLEPFALNLLQWFRTRTAKDPDPSADVWETEASLHRLLAFTRSQGVLHLDAHFENILTDGEDLFLSDWGLAISRAFDLDPEERTFFDRHENYDRCTAITSLVHAVVSRYDAREDWRQALREFMDGTHSAVKDLPDAARTYLAQRVPVAQAYREVLPPASRRTRNGVSGESSTETLGPGLGNHFFRIRGSRL